MPNNVAEKSELEQLFQKNECVGLDEEEQRRARELIANPIFSQDICQSCTILPTSPEWYVGRTIFDTGLCQDHAYLSLETRTRIIYK